MDPARMLTESLTPRPELENSQGQDAKSLLKLAFPLPPSADMPLHLLRSESCQFRTSCTAANSVVIRSPRRHGRAVALARRCPASWRS
jgi:hypothetical protein